MEKIKIKHFQYAGLDDFDRAIDEQINDFLESEHITADKLIDIKYSATSIEGINNYTALVIYKIK